MEPKQRKTTPGNNANSTAPKAFACTHEGCSKRFTRAEHLQRHALNHTLGDATCPRCRAHFKRPDLLDRHLQRHRQKDQEAGAEGAGVLNTRKRSWRAPDGSVVQKRPTPKSSPHRVSEDHPLSDGVLQQPQDDGVYPGVPISPPISSDHSVSDRGSLPHSIHGELHDAGVSALDEHFGPTIAPVSALEQGFLPSQEGFWAAPVPSTTTYRAPSQPAEFPYDDVFQADTASSFNMPYTTAFNYNWLFSMNDGLDPAFGHSAMELDFQSADQGQQHINLSMHDFSTSPGSQTLVSSTGHPGEHDYQSGMQAPPKPSQSPQPNFSSPVYMQNPHAGAIQQAHPSPASTTSARITKPVELERPLSTIKSPHNLPVIDEDTRDQLIMLIDSCQPAIPEPHFGSWDEHPLLSMASLQEFCDLYFTRFNTAYPLIHHATFNPSQAEPLLLLSILLLGATYSGKDAHQLAVCIHDVIRPRIFAHAGFSAKPDLWVLQTILLVECFGKSRAGQKQHDMSHLFHGLLINLIRRSDYQSVKPVGLEGRDPNPDDLELVWRQWAQDEEKKRLVLLCFMWDTQHAVLFCQSLCMSAFELRTPLPCSQTLWEAPSAEEWKEVSQVQPAQKELLFLQALKAYLTPTSPHSSHTNALSRILLLHGLMSISWDMQRRDQTSLGVVNFAGGTNWRDRLADAYDLWKADFDAYCMEVALRQRQSLASEPARDTEDCSSSSTDLEAARKEFATFSASYNAVYHAANVLLHSDFLDIQIYAGARHILGRPVQRADYLRSERVVKRWAAQGLSPAAESPGSYTPDSNRAPDDGGSCAAAAKAAWHAACLLHDASNNLDDFDAMGLFHVPWCLYLATLTCWAFHHARPGRAAEDDDGEIVWDARREMDGLVASMSGAKPWNLVSLQGRRKTGGLVWVMANALSKVRWGIIHAGVIVLRGLVPLRLINQYDTF
ncbi:Transcription factor [Pleurostoma richardsiae]|uniref:Transcription factor n=1 Tax=Pleurostoma richardsiae TaxID=41990 RepID=A0AA38VGC7_9PEZI|nr:Transcription factor [Pleurostoma richardsiae]